MSSVSVRTKANGLAPGGLMTIAFAHSRLARPENVRVFDCGASALTCQVMSALATPTWYWPWAACATAGSARRTAAMKEIVRFTALLVITGRRVDAPVL